MNRPSGLVLSLFGAAAIVAACSKDPEILERPVFVYSPRACPVSQSDAYSVIYAGGDFEPSQSHPPIASIFLREVGRAMTELPKETRSLVVDISQRDIDWRGLTDIPAEGPVNVLVWPAADACRLTRDIERRTDMSIGVAGHHVIVAGGRSLDGSQVPHTYVGDLRTGAIERLAFGLNTRRAWPTITEFRAPLETDAVSALVAGGEDPDSGEAIQNAEIYVPKLGAPSDVGDFEREPIPLSEPRTRHAAVVLSTGETLLVGGAGSTSGPLRTMEIVDPITRRGRTAGVALLSVARRDPTAIRLASGEILVAGGTGPTGDAVPTLEWFSADASRSTKRPVDLVTGRERAIVPLESGGALAVILPEKGAGPDFKTVWVISADGTLEPGLPIDPASLDVIRLFPGAEGAPVLWTGRRWLRWAPWFGAFQPIADSPDRGPSLTAITSGDPGLALWLDDRVEAGMNITGFRFATRSRFDAIPKPLLVTGPEQLAPDRLVGQPGSTLRFDDARGLLLNTGASAFLTDVTFAAFELSLDVTANAPSIVIRAENGIELEVGGGSCPLTQTPTQHIDLRRRERQVDVRVDGSPARVCPTELPDQARVSLGLRGSASGLSGARNLIVTRR